MKKPTRPLVIQKYKTKISCTGVAMLQNNFMMLFICQNFFYGPTKAVPLDEGKDSFPFQRFVGKFLRAAT